MFKRKDNGLWQEVLRELNGKPLDKPKYIYGKTQAEVKRKINEYKGEAERGELFERVADLWWEEHEPKLAYNTATSYKPAKVRAVNAFGDRPAKDITPSEINRDIKNFSKTHADKTVRTQLMVYNLIFKYAVAEGFVLFNPARDLCVPSGLAHNKIHAPTREDVERVKQAIDCQFGLFAYMAMYTGMRRGELLALSWEDINLEARTITINKSLYFINNSPRIKLPKTKTSAGQVPILDALLPSLARSKPGLVFPNDEGNYLSATQFQRKWKLYCKESGVTATPHQFRHCYATMLVEAGVAPEKAQALLRHAQLSTTMDVYREIRGDERTKIFKEVYSVDIT